MTVIRTVKPDTVGDGGELRKRFSIVANEEAGADRTAGIGR